ncbi:polar amino acid transport system substrate-binding protein [Neorhizobium galegae]|uniref:transporter substrate-binding domain-containing protein n=1 Tax=Neorhizobium galegae TaxID=399 RepID=UPI002785CF1E|nr:transporter substrate-binding domain-containing protein [Neorhizobium galegae]MDQ0137717.1 polar amino acid transport system substrate-binding protein [Neorhizobium galegae]
MMPKFRLTACLMATLSLFAMAPVVAHAQETASVGAANTAAPLYSKVPERFRNAGAISVAITTDAPPYQFYEEGSRNLKGVNLDLLKALSQVTGVPFKLEAAAFPSILPGLQTKRFDMAVGPFGANPERLKVVNILNFLHVSQVFVGRSDTAFQINSLDDLCGRKVAEFQGDTNLATMKTQAEKCQAAGRPELALSVYKDNAAQWQGLFSGRDEVLISSAAFIQYRISTSKGAMKVVSPGIGDRNYIGWLIPKTDDELVGVLGEAMKLAMSSGAYGNVLKTWNIAGEALKEARVNGEPLAN